MFLFVSLVLFYVSTQKMRFIAFSDTRYLLHIKVKISYGQLIIVIWNLGVRSELNIVEISLHILIYKIYNQKIGSDLQSHKHREVGFEV